MASIEEKLRDLLEDLNISDHLLEIFDECGVDFCDLLEITADQIRRSLEPTQINWKYSVLFELISSWRTRNESKIYDLVAGYRLRLTGKLCVDANSVEPIKTSPEPSNINDPFNLSVSYDSSGSNTVEDHPYRPVKIEEYQYQQEHENRKQESSTTTRLLLSQEPNSQLRFIGELTDITTSCIQADKQIDHVRATCSVNEKAPCLEPGTTSDECENIPITAPSQEIEPKPTCSRVIETTLPSSDVDSDALNESLAPCTTDESEEVLEEPEQNVHKNISRAQPKNANESSSAGETSTVPQDESNVFNTKVLEKLLRFTQEKEILQCATKAELSDDKQQELSTIIAKHHLKTRSKLLTDDLRKYALAVTSLFKFERQETYFIPRSGDRKNHGGKIANKIGNLKQRKRKREVKEHEYQSTKQIVVDPTPSRNIAAEEAVEWLMLNSEPWSVVLEKWKISHEVRKVDLLSLKRIPQIFMTYPQYKSQHGFQLIDIDYSNLFPNTDNGLKKLPLLLPRITEYISKKALDPSAKPLLTRLNDEGVSKDEKICTLLLALCTVLPPIAVAPRLKPTILVAQEDILLFVDSKEQASAKVRDTYRSYAELNLPIVPKLVAVGENATKLNGTFIVCYDDVRYEVQSASRAVDILIKLTTVLGIPFSKISKLVWHFLSDYIYGIQQKESYASINKLKKYLENRNEQ